MSSCTNERLGPALCCALHAVMAHLIKSMMLLIDGNRSHSVETRTSLSAEAMLLQVGLVSLNDAVARARRKGGPDTRPP